MAEGRGRPSVPPPVIMCLAVRSAERARGGPEYRGRHSGGGHAESAGADLVIVGVPYAGRRLIEC